MGAGKAGEGHPGGLTALWSLPLRLLSRILPGRSAAPAGRDRSGTGRWGERVAAEYLESQGYEILERNFRVRGGEADLICAKDGLVVVVEVKTRLGKRFGAPQEAVDRRKARRVLQAGRVYCRKRGLSLVRMRADVVSVEGEGTQGPPRVRHFVGAIGER